MLHLLLKAWIHPPAFYLGVIYTIYWTQLPGIDIGLLTRLLGGTHWLGLDSDPTYRYALYHGCFRGYRLWQALV